MQRGRHLLSSTSRIIFGVLLAVSICGSPAFSKEKRSKKNAESSDATEKNSDKTSDKSPENSSAIDGQDTSAEKPERAEKSERSSERSERPEKSEKTSELRSLMDNLDYPELQVVPRATERLAMEAKDEKSSWFMTHWQFEISGLFTALVGFSGSSQARKDLTTEEKDMSSKLGAATGAVGASWFLAGVLLGMRKPYQEGMNNITKYSGKGIRAAVLRERLAEEAMERPTRVIRPLKWVSAFTNFSMNMAMGYYLTDQGRVMAGIAAFLAFLPMMYEDHNISVYERHLEYKAKIYGPVSSVVPHYDSQSKKAIPFARLTWTF